MRWLWIPLTFTIVLFCSLLSLAQAPAAPRPEKKASEVFKNVQVLKDMPSDQLIPAMQFITSFLGVPCEYCRTATALPRSTATPDGPVFPATLSAP
jgi:hypothetical protein